MTYSIDYALVDGDAAPSQADFEKVKAEGYGIVGIRGAWGYHGRASVDPTLERDAAHARAAGCQVFGYLFLEYETDVAAQVRALTSSYQRQPGDLPVMLDLEMDSPPPGTTPGSRLKTAEAALQELQAAYGEHGAWVYTSLDQWGDHFGDLDSEVLGRAPLCIKTAYAWNPRNPPHLESCGPVGALPRPWRRPGSPGAWLQQFQGDAIGILSSTTDISKFLNFDVRAPDARAAWLCGELGCGPAGLMEALRAFQTAHGLAADAVAGAQTFARLCM